MPRSRSGDLESIVEQFTRRLGSALERFITSRVAKETRARGNATGRRRRTRVLCYFPGCRNVAAPRFSMFCAAEHKNLSKAEKEKYRAQRLQQEQPAPAKKRIAARKGRR